MNFLNSDIATINFPYFWYPNLPFCGYMDTREYNKNLIKLNKFLTNLTRTISGPVLFHLTIGAAMEELILSYESYANHKQWRQLFPMHIETAINKNIPVIHYIICPNRTFSSDGEFKDPAFIKHTNGVYYWKKEMADNIPSFRSEKYDIVVYIFYTLCPTIDGRNENQLKLYKKKLVHLEKTFNGSTPEQYDYNTYIQTQNDKMFVNNFYRNLHNTLLHINEHNGVITCFSFAVFNHHCDSKFLGINYGMFKELPESMANIDNVVLGEWVYGSKNYFVVDNRTRKKISYVENQLLLVENDNSLKVYVAENVDLQYLIDKFINFCNYSDNDSEEMDNFLNKINNISFEQNNSCVMNCSSFNIDSYMMRKCRKQIKCFNNNFVDKYIQNLCWIKKLKYMHNLNSKVLIKIYYFVKFNANSKISRKIIKEYDILPDDIQIGVLELVSFSNILKKNIYIFETNKYIKIGSENNDNEDSMFITPDKYALF